MNIEMESTHTAEMFRPASVNLDKLSQDLWTAKEFGVLSRAFIKDSEYAKDGFTMVGELSIEDGTNDSRHASSDDASRRHIKFDYNGKHHDVIVKMELPDGSSLTRVSEELQGRDKGNFVLKGYKFPDGSLIEKEIRRNNDGSMSVLDLDPFNRKNDRHEKRMSEADFVAWVEAQKKH